MSSDPDRNAIARLLSRVQAPAPGQARNNMVRRAATSVVTQRVSRRAGVTGVKAAQAWKYPGFNVVRAPSVEINGTRYFDPKADENTPRRKQESNFFITINPNFIETPGSAAAYESQNRFKNALDHLSKNETIARILKFGPRDDHYVLDKAKDVILPGVQFTSSVEVGEVQSRMHCHIWMTIEHYSQIQINVKMMQDEFRRGYNGDVEGAVGLPFGDPRRITGMPYLQVKLLPESDWTTVMRQYIKKGMTS